MDEMAAAFSEFAHVIRGPYWNTYDRRLRSFHYAFGDLVLREVANAWRAENPDVIHIVKQNLEDGLDLLATADSICVPSLCVIHITQSAAYLGARMSFLRDWVSRRRLSGYRGLLVTTPQARARTLRAILPAGRKERVAVVDSGVEIPDLAKISARRAEIRSELGLCEGEMLFTCVARLEAQKRPLLFLEKATEARKKYPNWKFLWIGGGRMESDWNRWLDVHGEDSGIRRLPWKADFMAYLAASDVYFHTASFEGFPLALLNAMSCGLPALIFDDLQAELEVFDASEIIVSQIGDTNWMGEVSDPVRRASVAKCGWKKVCSHYSIAAMAQRYFNLYTNIW